MELLNKFLGWLACTGTPKSDHVVYVDSSYQDFRAYVNKLYGYECRIKSWAELAKYRHQPTFVLTQEELDVRAEWKVLLDSYEYCLRKLKQLPKHFKIGSVVFLWDADHSDTELNWDYLKDEWYIKSYIDGRPELDNGECCISRTKFFNTGGGNYYYKLSNIDLLTYIMNNLDKVVAQ